MTDVPTAPEVKDASESPRVNPYSMGQCPPKQEAYVTVDTLKNFMTTITDTIIHQVTE
mgnify:CR=1 FL=1